jgi:hypothetical protein
VLDLGRDRRDDLDRRRAGADDRDPLAAQVDGVVPPGRVHRRAREVADPRDVRQLRLGEDPGRPDDVARRDRAAVRGRQAPEVRVLVPLGARHGGGQPQPGPQPVVVDELLGVGLQLVARRVHARPRLLAERELVAERRDVDLDAGIAVPVPGAADPVAFLEQDEVLDARSLDRDGGADAREARADDRDVDVRRG